jgi:hypothetical protein
MNFPAEITAPPIAKFVFRCGVSGLFRLCLEQKLLMVISEDREAALLVDGLSRMLQADARDEY